MFDSRVVSERFNGERVLVHPHRLNVGLPGHDERMLMPDPEQRNIAEAVFDPKPSREEIKDAIRLEEARRAAMVKNLYRLRSLRLSQNQDSTQSKK